MEKFGIFELLDALSAVTQAVSEEPFAPQKEEQTKELSPKRRPDAAFAPPVYGAKTEHMDAENKSDHALPPTGEALPSAGENDSAPSAKTAYDKFLARHEAATGRVKKGG